jgi:hypothetical protein
VLEQFRRLKGALHPAVLEGTIIIPGATARRMQRRAFDSRQRAHVN